MIIIASDSILLVITHYQTLMLWLRAFSSIARYLLFS